MSFDMVRLGITVSVFPLLTVKPCSKLSEELHSASGTFDAVLCSENVAGYYLIPFFVTFIGEYICTVPFYISISLLAHNCWTGVGYGPFPFNSFYVCKLDCPLCALCNDIIISVFINVMVKN